MDGKFISPIMWRRLELLKPTRRICDYAEMPRDPGTSRYGSCAGINLATLLVDAKEEEQRVSLPDI